MSEELNEDEVEERLYAMLHYGNEPQSELASAEELERAVQAAPCSTLRRYWHVSEPAPSIYQRVNNTQPSQPPPPPQLNHDTKNLLAPPLNIDKNETNKTDSIPKKEPDDFDMSVFQEPISSDVQITVQIIDDNPVAFVELESSDEDDVMEVALPPKPTITIESSEDEAAPVVTSPKENKNIKNKNDNETERETSTSPVPSVVSSVSDDFIRGDCIALNISSKKPACKRFDFSLHGPDLVEPPAKKKKKKNKVTSTPVTTTEALEIPKDTTSPTFDSCFATPKTKSKKKQKNKPSKVAQQSFLHTDSDSNHSTDVHRALSFIVSEKSFPNADVYESDSSQSEMPKAARPTQTTNSNNSSTESENKDSQNTNKTVNKQPAVQKNNSLIDLTSDVSFVEDVEIVENIVMANVTGFQEPDQSDHDEPQTKNTQLGSTKVPKILSESLDFDFLKGNVSGKRKRLYSYKNLREEMDKFYNESWGGEDFNHKEILKTMSRDRSLWQIDPKDRMPTPTHRRITCNYCGRVGHRDDACYQKPAVCHVCGDRGHSGTRCPRKICLNCGAPNHVYSGSCSRCAHWARVKCACCRRAGHPAPRCPDLWRRYHSTIDNNVPLEAAALKPSAQQHCSACARRGHLAHACRLALPMAPGPLPSPLVLSYSPVYPPDAPDAPHTHPSGRQSESDRRSEPRSPRQQKPRSKSADGDKRVEQARERRTSAATNEQERPPPPMDRDANGHVIQDNEVSDTSSAVGTARVYVTDGVRHRLEVEAGQAWLRETANACAVRVKAQDQFLAVTGTPAAQDAFQAAMREWTALEASVPAAPDDAHSATIDMSKNKNKVLRQLNKALDSLNQPVADPRALYKELNYLRSHHESLLRQKIVSPKKLANNREYIRGVVRKLNLVLVGQAGLGGGARHVAALRSLRARLVALRPRQISDEMRAEVAAHYDRVFAATPRDDYARLLQLYYQGHPTRHSHKKKGANLQFQENRGMIAAPPPPRAPPTRPLPLLPAANSPQQAPRHVNPALQVALVGAAEACHRRLTAARPAGQAARLTRLQLSRKLHSKLASAAAGPAAPLSARQIKQMRKLVDQTNEFLKIHIV